MNSSDWDRVSADYYTEILSPLEDSDKNPLFKHLELLEGSVIDLGCGIGPLLPLLSDRFQQVTALDFSQEMLSEAKKNNPGLRNVKYVQADLRNLNLRKRYDVAVSVNSILAPNIAEVDVILNQIYKILKPGGTLLAVIPAMEVYLYQAMLIVDENKHDLKRARRKALQHITPEEHDFWFGTITFDGDTQKCFYRFEIGHLFGKAGFKNMMIDKVLYSWEEFSRAGQLYFPEARKPWDWYVRCEK